MIVRVEMHGRNEDFEGEKLSWREDQGVLIVYEDFGMSSDVLKGKKLGSFKEWVAVRYIDPE